MRLTSQATRTSTALVVCLCFAASFALAAQTRGDALGIFDAHSDVGETPKKGSATYDSATGEYRITGGGANIWSTTDAFQFVWKRLSGDVTVTADVRFIGTGKEDHRKA